MKWPSINFGRGITRIWIAIVGIAEMIALIIFVENAWRRYPKNPFDKFDEAPASGPWMDYAPLPPLPPGFILDKPASAPWEHLAPIAVVLVTIPLAGYIIWHGIRWIAKGFQHTN